jgi:neutral ceramidase
MQARSTHRAEVQALAIGDRVIVGVPGELFVEHGLQVKEAAYPAHALIATCTNGRVGYIPSAAAFRRGGYETTFAQAPCWRPRRAT